MKYWLLTIMESMWHCGSGAETWTLESGCLGVSSFSHLVAVRLWAWREEPDILQSTGSQRVGRDCGTDTHIQHKETSAYLISSTIKL